jgi:ADP-ribosyl-[dinitrogen reductase] hydrolase
MGQHDVTGDATIAAERPEVSPTRESKVIGCLLGGAIGDALGMPLTGMSRAEIAALGGVADFLPAAETAALTIPLTALAEGEIDDPLAPGQWTDDTQLTLALADTLAAEGGLFVPDAWAHALVRWLNESPRAPGLSSIEAAVQLRTGGAEWDEAADPEGGGCGAATRSAPIGVVYSDDAPTRRRCARLQAMTTHGHADAQAAAVAVSEAVALALSCPRCDQDDWSGVEFLQALVEAVRAESPDFAEFARCLELAKSLLDDDIDPETAVRVLGVSAWSREAVPAALYLVARQPASFEALLTATVNLTGGAVESIAAMAGAIGGALHGVEAIPARWRRGVEDAPRLLEAALSLSRLRR